jgi:hypothetical protein
MIAVLAIALAMVTVAILAMAVATIVVAILAVTFAMALAAVVVAIVAMALAAVVVAVLAMVAMTVAVAITMAVSVPMAMPVPMPMPMPMPVTVSVTMAVAIVVVFARLLDDTGAGQSGVQGREAAIVPVAQAGAATAAPHAAPLAKTAGAGPGLCLRGAGIQHHDRSQRNTRRCAKEIQPHTSCPTHGSDVHARLGCR